MKLAVVVLASSLSVMAVHAGHHLGHAVVPAYVAAQEVHPYAFGYEVKDAWGNTQHRHEVSDEYNTKRGSYGYTDAHGIYRRVEYVADDLGFRAVVKTNEPGTRSHYAADAQYHSTAPQPEVHHQHKGHVEVPVYVDASPQHTVVVADGAHGHYGYH
ncbi:hypothetical protein HPB48_002477 [Haemaphysalis longicornis]|uniref:Cuticle protein n=1 Tax=Haemaphysalis longicornis TaxID=44386 RepID=A0A9J6G7T5_HAELO|nr:hypothetical protein HPB48_002477 [Haemaphysalis longicornis]